MSEEQKRLLQQQLWNIANTLRGKMNADEFRDYILGFIFYKYLSEKVETYANKALEPDNKVFAELDETKPEDKAYIDAIREEAVEDIGYFLKPSELFHVIAQKGNKKTDNYILVDLIGILKNIEQSTMGH